MALLALTALLGAGCGGISATQTVSPLNFILPGLIKNDVAPATNAPVAFNKESNVLASAK